MGGEITRHYANQTSLSLVQILHWRKKNLRTTKGSCWQKRYQRLTTQNVLIFYLFIFNLSWFLFVWCYVLSLISGEKDYDLIHYWNSTGIKGEEINSLYEKTVDDQLALLYLKERENGGQPINAVKMVRKKTRQWQKWFSTYYLLCFNQGQFQRGYKYHLYKFRRLVAGKSELLTMNLRWHSDDFMRMRMRIYKNKFAIVLKQYCYWIFFFFFFFFRCSCTLLSMRSLNSKETLVIWQQWNPFSTEP